MAISKKLFLIVLGLLLLLTIPVSTTFAQDINASFTIGSLYYSLNGVRNTMDTAPYIKNGRTYIPLRFAAYSLGVKPENINWNNSTKIATLTKGNSVVQVKIGKNSMLLNGTAMSMDVAPEILNGRTMLPLRYVAQAFGVTVSWDATTNTALLGDTSSYQPQPANTPFINTNGVRVVPSLIYNATDVIKKDFTWEYGGSKYSWHVEIPSPLYSYDQKINKLVNDFYNADGSAQNKVLSGITSDLKQLILSLTTKGNYIAWVKEDPNDKFVAYLAERLQLQANSDGYDYFQTAEFVQSFVGGAIPYKFTSKPFLLSQTLIDDGDCKDKSILYAAILNKMGYHAALLDFPPPPGTNVGHMAVGINFSDNQLPGNRNMDYYLDNGIKYYFAETTEKGWIIGEISDKTLEKKGYVYPIN